MKYKTKKRPCQLLLTQPLYYFFSFHVFLFRILGLHTEQRIFRGLIEFLEKMRQVLP